MWSKLTKQNKIMEKLKQKTLSSKPTEPVKVDVRWTVWWMGRKEYG